ncbi:cell surface protein [Lactiplantibacillus sp. WILCCON 0030]|uniref:Cell surface protein n=1 Tax=Lactiplantibacillus brownii TaxID=3069269 RepID=A0ABU1ABJ1_9LACO|nr:cell surface protein [Lactiplantibacillus brownii]MDQ7938299.1 cell surface protein [Lactiplantibacillus brownii]
MWDGKKWGKLLGLTLFTLVLLSLVMPVNSDAASTMTDVTTGTGSTFSKTSGNIVFGNSGYGLGLYPNLTAVTANNTKNNRITTATTQIKITFSDTITAKKGNISKLYYDVMTADGRSVQPKTPTSYVVNGTNSKDLGSSGTSQTLTVDLSNLRNVFPLYVGFRYISADGEVAYRFGQFYGDNAISASLKPTITGDLNASDTVIKGTGTNVGDIISSDVNGVTTTVSQDGTYTLDLGQTLSGLSNVKVTESNEFGDSGSVDGAVSSKSLTLTSAATTADTYPDDLASFNSDSDVISWLVKKAGIKATYSDNSSADGVTFTSDTTDLATKLKALADGKTLAVPVYAKDSDGLKSEPITVTVTNHVGVLQFGTISDKIGFGSLEVPTSETLFQPATAWDVNVSDTRASGATWQVYATATPLTSATRTMAGNLVYKDGSNQTVLTDNSTLIASGSKVAGTTNTAITGDWSSTKGIMLDAQPSVYADTYAGKVNWTLQDTPTQ